EADRRFEQVLELESEVIRALLAERDAVWLATDQRLMKWDRNPSSSGSLRSHDYRQLVSGGRPFAIHSLADGSLWLILTSGMIQLKNDAMAYFGADRGLAIGELLEGAAAVLDDGRIALGGSQGLAVFNPLAVAPRRPLPQAHVMQVSVQGQALPSLDGIQMSADQRDVAIEFAAPGFLDPEGTRYRVRLLPDWPDWQDTSGRQYQEYFALRAGRHRFEVQVGDQSGRWSGGAASLSFQIEYPLWRQSWAYLVYLLLGLAIAAWVYRIRQRALKRRQAFLQARQQRAIAEAAREAQSDFLAVMSHEMRTPLHGVLGMLELIKSQAETPKTTELIDTVQRSGQQLKRIVDDVLDLSSLEAGQLRLHEGSFELMGAIEQVIDLFAPLADEKAIDLRLRVASDLPMVARGDRDRLLQILSNLVSNAIKFTESGGVEIELTHQAGSALKLRVSDSGPGIATANRERLFKKYQRLPSDHHEQQRGTGLGLVITRQLALAMRGAVELRESSHRGACFEVVLRDFLLAGSAPQTSALLEGLRLDSEMSAHDVRTLHRLARRWGFCHQRRVRANGSPSDLLIVDPRVRMPIEEPERYARILYLHPGRIEVPEAWIQDARFVELTWPLTERRLLRALINHVMSKSQERA
ncbi:MAG: ATP-binding protein, partial [Pseudomonadota bacterium]